MDYLENEAREYEEEGPEEEAETVTEYDVCWLDAFGNDSCCGCGPRLEGALGIFEDVEGEGGSKIRVIETTYNLRGNGRKVHFPPVGERVLFRSPDCEAVA